jgi:hypothetical protein
MLIESRKENQANTRGTRDVLYPTKRHNKKRDHLVTTPGSR